jgi:biotin operon repressor
MSDIAENALILLGILMEEGATGSRQLTAGELCAKSGLSPDEFDQADSFLLNGRYVEGTMGGDKGRRWLTSDGINYYQTQIADRYPLSQMAKRAAKLIMTKIKTDRDEVSGDKICAELEIDRETYVQTMQELADSGLIQEPIQVQQPGFSFSGVNLTAKGRRAVRSNFKREGIGPVQQIGAIFQGPVSQSNIQAVAQAYRSTVQQTIEAADVEELRATIIDTIESMVNAIKTDLTTDQLAVYAQAARELKNEINTDQPQPSRLHVILRVLAFFGDLEGTLELGERSLKLAATIGPSLVVLLQAISQLLASLP